MGMMNPMQQQMGMGQMGGMGMGMGMGQGMMGQGGMGQNYGSAWKNLVSGRCRWRGGREGTSWLTIGVRLSTARARLHAQLLLGRLGSGELYQRTYNELMFRPMRGILVRGLSGVSWTTS